VRRCRSRTQLTKNLGEYFLVCRLLFVPDERTLVVSFATFTVTVTLVCTQRL
jgi:hypothetical protein